MAARGASVANLMLSYAVGFAGACLLSLFVGQPIVAIVVLAGSVIALPFLAVAVAVLLLAHRSVRRNLAAWCVAAPFGVALAWLLAEYLGDYRARGFDLSAYLDMRSVWERAAVALACAAFVALAFYVRERQPRI